MNIAASNNKWWPTLSFRRYRAKHAALSGNYWFHQLATHNLRLSLDQAAPDALVSSHVPPPFALKRFAETVSEMWDQLEGRENAFRLNMLVMAAASLESYLEEAVTIHIGNLGHCNGPYELNAVGKALGSPVLRSSTIPDMLKYVEILLGISLDQQRTEWTDAFKLRCAAAHNGGVVTPKVLRDIPDIGIELGEYISLSWDQLVKYLDAAFDIASKVDQKVASNEASQLELTWHLSQLRELHKLPARDDLWQYVDSMKFRPITTEEKKIIEAAIY
ncbi:MAG: hypothetical protein JNK74_16330 [Candidatus Hydrogenedentes bacterium]|nr:hypothetical protein [Candidatus Hydrogenedentota bacterium]